MEISDFFSSLGRSYKSLAKLGNIVADANVSNLAARETCVAEANFAARKQKCFWSQKHFCFPDSNFASKTYVSQFSHPGKNKKKHCFRNNVSKLSKALTLDDLNLLTGDLSFSVSRQKVPSIFFFFFFFIASHVYIG